MSTRLLWTSYETVGDIEDRRLVAPFGQLSSSELAVLRHLLWRLNDETGRCNPSDVDIAAGTALCEKTVRTARSSLRKKGLIDWKPVRKEGRRAPNDYTISQAVTVTGRGGAQTVNIPRQAVNGGGSGGKWGPLQAVAVTEEHRSKNKEENKEEEQVFPSGFEKPTSLPANEQQLRQRVEEAVEALEDLEAEAENPKRRRAVEPQIAAARPMVMELRAALAKQKAEERSAA